MRQIALWVKNKCCHWAPEETCWHISKMFMFHDFKLMPSDKPCTTWWEKPKCKSHEQRHLVHQEFTCGNIVWGNLEITLVKNLSGIRIMEIFLIWLKVTLKLNEACMSITDIFTYLTQSWRTSPHATLNSSWAHAIALSASRCAAFSHYILIDWLQQFHIQGQLSSWCILVQFSVGTSQHDSNVASLYLAAWAIFGPRLHKSIINKSGLPNIFCVDFHLIFQKMEQH